MASLRGCAAIAAAAASRSTSAAAAAAAAVRSAALRSKAPPLKPSPPRRAAPLFRRSMALGSVESLMPLHSAVAAARLRSFIAADSSCWSWLSQDFAVPR